jgi:predicted alpha/beta superfamily hydrolase
MKDLKMENIIDVLGTLQTIENFPTKWLNPRRVDIWLPPEYRKDKSQRFSVLYMHDGQNLFIPELSYTKIDWGLDEAIVALRKQDKIAPTMVVGIWNTPNRVLEYMPAKPLRESGNTKEKIQVMPFHKKEKVLSDQYLKFIVSDLKPYIDSHFQTQPDVDHTAIMGSSMGGLISLYAVCEYPEIFGSAGCISTHWPIAGGAIVKFLPPVLPKPDSHRFYFDFGTEELDSNYEKYQKRVDAIMERAGYSKDKNWTTRRFAGAGHAEKYWRERIHIPLEFLLS